MIETPRLILRQWEDHDREPFHAMCRDPQVMATLGPLMTRAQSDALIDRLIEYATSRGYTFWAIERRGDGEFLGFCGLKPGAIDTPIEGQIEIGWRLGASIGARAMRARRRRLASIGRGTISTSLP